MRKRQVGLWTLGTACLLAWAGARSWGEDEAAPAVGLNGILPAYAPEGLGEEDFSRMVETIDPNWKAWTEETAAFVKAFYEEKPASLEEQRLALQRLNVKLGTLDKALRDPRYRSIHTQLRTLQGRLQPEVALAEAMLDTLALDPDQSRGQRLGPAYDRMQSQLRALQSDLRQYRGGERWNEWLNARTLASARPGDAAALNVIQGIKAKLEKRESYAEEVRNFVSREPFLALEDGLEAVIQAATGPAPSSADVQRQMTELLTALSDFRTGPSQETEARVRASLNAVRAVAPDGGVRLADAVGAHFLNYNLRVVATEGLINRFYREQRREGSRVHDRVMEAMVVGYQCTDVEMSLDLIPSYQNARFAITLSGIVNSNTNGYTHQATVHTVGRHSFFAQKDIVFDGQAFYGEPSRANVRANNRTVDAVTKFTRIPLLGRIADNVAMREATSRTPQANAIAAQKISSQVRQNLDREAETQFANATRDLQTNTYGPLRKYDMYPDVMSVSTTENELRLWSRLMGGRETGGSRPTPIASVPSNGLVAQVHESLLTHSMDRMGLAGQTMTDAEVRELLESRFSEILGREVKFDQSTAIEDTTQHAEVKNNRLIFDANDPVRFTIANNVITLIIRAGLLRDNGEEIPTQIISVPFTPTLRGDKILLTRGNVGVRPVTRPSNVPQQVARANVMRQKIQASLPEREVDAVFDVTQQSRTVRLYVTDLTADAGWLTVTLQ